MAYQDNSTSYAFGQMGNVLMAGGNSDITSNEVTGMEKAVFVAITFLEDSVFESSNNNGIVAEDNALWLNDTSASTGIDATGAIVTDSVTFPAGVTIYGRWTKLDLVSGKAIAYIGY